MILDNHIHLWALTRSPIRWPHGLAEAGIAEGVLISPAADTVLSTVAAPLAGTITSAQCADLTQGRDTGFRPID